MQTLLVGPICLDVFEALNTPGQSQFLYADGAADAIRILRRGVIEMVVGDYDQLHQVPRHPSESQGRLEIVNSAILPQMPGIIRACAG